MASSGFIIKCKCNNVFFTQCADPLALDLFIGPMSILFGLGFGAVWGMLANYIPEKEDVSNCSVQHS